MANVEGGARSATGWPATASAVSGSTRDTTAGSASVIRSVQNSGQQVPGSSSGPTTQQQPAVDQSNIDELVAKANDSAQIVSRNLRINVDDASGKYVVTVLDTKTDEVIRQFPSEELLRMAETLSRIMEENNSKGSLLDEHT